MVKNNMNGGSLMALGVLLSSFLACVSADATCSDPQEIGELRVLKSKQCVDIKGSGGAGDIKALTCDGYSDQQIILCGDGTIRNKAENYCFQADVNGNNNVYSGVCSLLPKIPDYQKWVYGRTKRFTDNGGIVQTAREIINVKSGKCLDVVGLSGDGDMGTSPCENRDDQYFYIRSRGQLVAHGRLQNQRSGKCLDVAGVQGGSDNDRNVLLYHCEDEKDQWFRFYQNGEIVNEKSNQCLDVVGHSGQGNIIINDACEDQPDQMWSRPKQLCQGEFCSFRNKKSGNCIDVAGIAGDLEANVGSHSCEGLADQRWKWITGKWTTPLTKWNMVGCNQNGKVTQWITEGLTYSSTVTDSITIEVGTEIESGVEFLGAGGKVKASFKMATTLSKQFTNTKNRERRITFTCENYDNNEAFNRGCMWQLEVTTTPVTDLNDPLSWTPKIVKCTNSNVAPACPPFTKCRDKACTQCESFSESAQS